VTFGGTISIMAGVHDPYATRRAELLDPVARWCAEAGVEVRAGDVRTVRGESVSGLICEAADGSWDAAVTVVRANPISERDTMTWRRFVRDPVTGYRLDSPGEIVYELCVTEDDDGDGAHGPRPVVRFQLLDDARAAADDLILWVRRADLFHADPPEPDAARAARRLRRQFDDRQTAAATPRVRADTVPREAAADVVALNLPALCWHFPRESTGRPQRSAVVALTSYGGHAAGRRGRWLVARAHDDGIALSIEELIGANQRHRWDLTPWLWDRRASGVPRAERWQVPAARAAAPCCAAIERGAVAEALELAGVGVDPQIAKLLEGSPTRLHRAEYTEKWVNRLYAGLADAAPWRFGNAFGAWAEQRRARGLPGRRPVALFGLGGMMQQRKPLVALDASDGTPTLRLVFSGSNEVLSRSLWTVPDDLAAVLHGWTPIIGTT